MAVPNEPVVDGECWFRVLTNTDYVTSDNTVHYQALKKSAFRESDGKPWSHEMSGRLVALAGKVDDIVAHAESRAQQIRERLTAQGKPVPRKIGFVGVACATVREICDQSECLTPRNVVYTPLADDSAHSDLVTFQTTSDEELDPVRNWLMAGLRVVRGTDVVRLIEGCGVETALSSQR